MAIKINTSSIFAIRNCFMWVTLNLTSGEKGKKKKTWWAWWRNTLTWKGVKSITLCRGVSKDFFSLTFGLLPFESDKTQVSSPAHALWVLDADYNVKYLCGNIIMVQIYWQWQRGIRASLLVPQDERVFHWPAPEAPWTTSWLKGRPHVRADSGGISVTLWVPETMIGGWIKWRERMMFVLDFTSKVTVCQFLSSLNVADVAVGPLPEQRCFKTSLNPLKSISSWSQQNSFLFIFLLFFF